jgi:hypothetical protein
MQTEIVISINAKRLIPAQFSARVSFLRRKGRHVEADALEKIEWPTPLENCVQNLSDVVDDCINSFASFAEIFKRSGVNFSNAQKDIIKSLSKNAR